MSTPMNGLSYRDLLTEVRILEQLVSTIVIEGFGDAGYTQARRLENARDKLIAARRALSAYRDDENKGPKDHG